MPQKSRPLYFNIQTLTMELSETIKNSISDIKKIPAIAKFLKFEDEQETEVKAEDVKSVDGTILRIEPAVEVGASVQVIDEAGELIDAPDGQIELEDGKLLNVEGGIIVEVQGAEGEEEEMATALLDTEEFGSALSALLNREIDKQAEDSGVDRAEIIANIASGAGIEEGTVNQIISGAIDCPPAGRLGGIAKALGDVNRDEIIAALESDGCAEAVEEMKSLEMAVEEITPVTPAFDLEKLQNDIINKLNVAITEKFEKLRFASVEKVEGLEAENEDLKTVIVQMSDILEKMAGEPSTEPKTKQRNPFAKNETFTNVSNLLKKK